MAQALVFAAVLVVVLAVPVSALWRRRTFGTAAELATFTALHEATVAARFLRAGLTAESAGRSSRHLRTLLGTPAVSLTDTASVLSWEGAGDAHASEALHWAGEPLSTGRTAVSRGLSCSDPACPVRVAVVAPLVLDDLVVGTLAAYAGEASPALVRAVSEVARWVAGQLELAELDLSRAQLAEAQVRALRAQISPHFVHNALTAIASYIRTDPTRARELLLEFADFVRYSSRTHGEFTTLAEELRSIDRYLLLERARFGERLQVVLRVAPEVLPVAVPYLCLQPLVENAVQHGLEEGTGTCTITIIAEDCGEDCCISVEDDGAGADPERVRASLAGAGESMGLGNVDSRLRASYGDEHGLVVETAVGAGTRVTLRIPKFAAGVRAS